MYTENKGRHAACQPSPYIGFEPSLGGEIKLCLICEEFFRLKAPLLEKIWDDLKWEGVCGS